MNKTARGPRRMSTLKVIADYHGVEPDVCFRCHEECSPHRAHVIERIYGGLDGVQNLVPLCPTCHINQPIFMVGEETRAWAWMSNNDMWTYYLRIVELLLRANPELSEDPDAVLAMSREEFDKAVKEAADRAGLFKA
jgi:hypothetical protein